MAGIKHLSEYLVKQGIEFLNNLLSNEVTITEKLDGSSFNIRKLDNDTHFEFYKRDGKTPITDLDRTLSIYYEKPIQHFLNLPDKVKTQIPKDTYISVEYFANNQPVEVYYSNLPKSGLVLTSVLLGNKYVYDKKELNEWADLIDVEQPPIIFQGKLNDKQKSDLIQFVGTPFEELVSKYKTQSFSHFIIPLLNPELKTTFLKNSLDDIIEGIVFNFKNDKESIFAKVVDPIFTEMAKNKAKERNASVPNDLYGMVVSDITDFINKVDLDDYRLMDGDFTSKYIDLMSQLFLDYFELKKDEYKDFGFVIPDFLNKEEHAINFDKIPYKNIIKIVKSNKNYLELYRLFIATFRKPKKKAVGYFTKEFLKIFNDVVIKIQEYINTTVNEFNILDLHTFAIINEDEEVLNNYDFNFKEHSIIDIPDHIRFSLLNEAELNTEPAKNPINVIIGRFQPIHRGHISISKFLKDANGYDSVYVNIRGEKPNVKSPISVETQQEIFSIVKKNENSILDFLQTNRVLAEEIFTLLRNHDYEPMSWGAGDDRTDEYKRQLDYILKVKDNQMNVNPNFDIINIPRNIVKVSGTMVRNSITNGDKNEFERCMPKYLYKFFDKLQDEIIVNIFVEGEFDESELKITKGDEPGYFGTTYISEIDKTIIKMNPLIVDKYTKKLEKLNYTFEIKQ